MIKNTVIILKAFISKINKVQNKDKIPFSKSLFKTIEYFQKKINPYISGIS